MSIRTTMLHDTLHTILERGPATGAVAVRHIERNERFDLDGDRP